MESLLYTEDKWFISLQHFANPEDEGRTEKPTEQRKKKAREDGKISKSTELSSAIILASGMSTLFGLSTILGYNTIEFFKNYIYKISSINQSFNSSLFFLSIYDYWQIFLPFALVLLVVAIGVNLFQVGFYISTKAIEPDFTKIMPDFGKWASKSFASSEAYFNIFKSLIIIIIIFTLSIVNVMYNINEIITISLKSIDVSFSFFLNLIMSIFAQITIIILAIGIIDFFFQKWSFERTIMMSKQDIKEENKQNEGDPLVKRRIKERMNALLSQNMIKKIPEADVLITNPTHFAIALKWDNTMVAPMVLAKGLDNMALRMRAIATENNVTIMENKPLARALYYAVEIGDIIPPEYWEIVSKILAEVYKITGKYNKDK